MADHNAKVVWRSGMVFDGVADGKTHLQIPLSSAHENPEEGDLGFSPMGLVMAALAACTSMDVISILKKKRQDVQSLEVEVEGSQDAEHPRVYRKVSIVYRVGGPFVEAAAVARAIELSLTKYCPVSAMLKEVAVIDYRYEILDLVES